jgi:ferredoxin-nitrite reductase
MMASASDSEPIYCPGLFEPAASGARFLIRLRTPGGLVNPAQARAIEQLAGQGNLLVTNRGNLQFDAAGVPDPLLLRELQSLGLAAERPELDRFRNIMASPTAGLDSQARMDVRPIVAAVDLYISSQPQLAQLSAKFAVGIDGGESLSIRQRPNDFWLVARSATDLGLVIRTENGPVDLNLSWPDGVAAVAAIADWYLQRSATAQGQIDGHRRSQRPRLRQFMTAAGLQELRQACLAAGAQHTAEPLPPAAAHNYQHLGVWPQQQAGDFYVGLALLLGEVTVPQWQGLRAIAQEYGSSQLRLSPWQNIILPDIRNVDPVLTALGELGLSADRLAPAGWLAACRGLRCSSGEADSAGDSRRFVEMLSRRQEISDQPVQIHISGCSKGCAHPLSSDIALLGRAGGYEIYAPEGDRIFGRLLYTWLPADLALKQVESILQAYNQHSKTLSFAEFAALEWPQSKTISQPFSASPEDLSLL